MNKPYSNMFPAPILSLKLHLKSANFVSNSCIFCLSASQEQQRTTIAVGMVNKNDNAEKEEKCENHW